MKLLVPFFHILLVMSGIATTACAIDVTGTVNSELDGPIVHASVAVLGTTLGAITNDVGEFHLALPAGNYRLRFSSVGCEPHLVGVDLTNGAVPPLAVVLKPNYLMMDQIIVTATKTERIYQEVAVPTMVLTGKEIQESGAVDVAGAISDRLGIDLRAGRVGGMAAEIQGADPKYILVLIDGEPVTGKFDDRTELNTLSTSRIDRIEIVKGPGSSLYGSEAMSGVINVITKSATRPLEVTVFGKTGDRSLQEGGATIGVSKNNWSWLLNGSSLHEGKTPRRDYLVLLSNDRQDASLKTSYRSTDARLRAELNAGYTDTREASHNETFRYETRVIRTDLRPSLKFQYRPWAEAVWKLRYSKYARQYDVYLRNNNIHDQASSNETVERSAGTEFDYWRQFAAGYEANFGATVQQSIYKAERVSWGQDKRNWQWSVFAQSEKRWKNQFTTIAGIRFDHNDVFGNFVSPKLSGMYTPNDWLKLRGSVGRGFRAPSWIELYLTFPHTQVGYEAYGNPDLKTETSIGYNLGYEILFSRKLLWTVNGFYNDFKDQIDDYTPRPTILSYRNIGSSYTRGFESTWKWYISQNLSTSTGYQWMEAYDREENRYLPHPRHSASIRVEAKEAQDKISLSLRTKFNVRFVQRFDLALGQYTDQFESFTTRPMLDATLIARGSMLKPSWKPLSISFGSTNLLDYTNDLYGPFTGRKVFASVEYAFSK